MWESTWLFCWIHSNYEVSVFSNKAWNLLHMISWLEIYFLHSKQWWVIPIGWSTIDLLILPSFISSSDLMFVSRFFCYIDHDSIFCLWYNFSHLIIIMSTMTFPEKCERVFGIVTSEIKMYLLLHYSRLMKMAVVDLKSMYTTGTGDVFPINHLATTNFVHSYAP